MDGHNPAAIEAALLAAKHQGARADGKPTLICCKTVIGMGSPNKAGTHDVHGAALGAAEVQATRVELGWTAAPFEIPAEIASAWNAQDRGAAAERACAFAQPRSDSSWCAAGRDADPAIRS